LQNSIDVVGTTPGRIEYIEWRSLTKGYHVPFLVGQYITSDGLFLLLNKVDICKHSIFLEGLGQLVGGNSAAVKASQRDQLEDKALLSKVPDKVLQVGFCNTR
jgi:hypothetical protein